MSWEGWYIGLIAGGRLSCNHQWRGFGANWNTPECQEWRSSKTRKMEADGESAAAHSVHLSHCLRLRSSVIGARRRREMRRKTRHHSCHPWGSPFILCGHFCLVQWAEDGRSRRKGSCPVLGCRCRSAEAPTSRLSIIAFCLGLAWKHPRVRGGASSPQGVQHPQGPGTDWALCLPSGEVASFREEGGSVEMEMRGQLPPGTAGRSLGGGSGV